MKLLPLEGSSLYYSFFVCLFYPRFYLCILKPQINTHARNSAENTTEILEPSQCKLRLLLRSPFESNSSKEKRNLYLPLKFSYLHKYYVTLTYA